MKKMAIIATKGTLDMAYPPFILGSTAAALGYEVQIFFTFYGLQLLRKDLSDVKISPLANPAMPMPLLVARYMPRKLLIRKNGWRACSPRRSPVVRIQFTSSNGSLSSSA